MEETVICAAFLHRFADSAGAVETLWSDVTVVAEIRAAFGANHAMSGEMISACARICAGEDWMGRGGQFWTFCWSLWRWRCCGAGPMGCGSVDAAKTWRAVLGSWSRSYLRSDWKERGGWGWGGG